jgi:hypothetical protein
VRGDLAAELGHVVLARGDGGARHQRQHHSIGFVHDLGVAHVREPKLRLVLEKEPRKAAVDGAQIAFNHPAPSWMWAWAWLFGLLLPGAGVGGMSATGGAI